MDQDPFKLLGIDRASTVDEVNRARRRLAKRAHPDHGGDAARMQAINAAADAALTALLRPVAPVVADEPVPDEATPGVWRRVATDSPSFTVEALPAETFEALVVVANWMGEVHVEDPPYVLESHLVEPFDCWCRLELVPDAGASTVALTLGTIDGRPVPDLDVVRDAWVAELNTLGRIEP